MAHIWGTSYQGKMSFFNLSLVDSLRVRTAGAWFIDVILCSGLAHRFKFDWVAAKELKLSYYTGGIRSNCCIYTH